MKSILIDTDIFIDHLRGNIEAKNFLEILKNTEYITYFSAITEAELVSGKECNNSEKLQNILDLLSLHTKLVINNEIAKKAGEFRRKYGIPLLDSIIAASAFVTKSKVVTKNIKHFKAIKEIMAISPNFK